MHRILQREEKGKYFTQFRCGHDKKGKAAFHRLIGGVLVFMGLVGVVPTVQAIPTSVLVMKLSDSTTTASDLDSYLGWTNAGGLNQGNAAAQLLVDNGLDYKNSLVDSNWADVLGVRVSMYRNGSEMAYVAFNPGTSKTNFFSRTNVTSSSWSDVAGPGNFFSIQGDSGIDRHWFVNNNYGGCGVDVGHMVVLDRRTSYPCSWENTRIDDVGSRDRGFLYSTATTERNWNTSYTGVADVFAVFVTLDLPATVPEPGSLALVGLSIFALAGIGRRYAKT